MADDDFSNYEKFLAGKKLDEVSANALRGKRDGKNADVRIQIDEERRKDEQRRREAEERSREAKIQRRLANEAHARRLISERFNQFTLTAISSLERAAANGESFVSYTLEFHHGEIEAELTPWEWESRYDSFWPWLTHVLEGKGVDYSSYRESRRSKKMRAMIRFVSDAVEKSPDYKEFSALCARLGYFISYYVQGARNEYEVRIKVTI